MEAVHTDSLAAPSDLDAHAGNEYVMPHATASHERLRDSPPDGSQSAIGGVQNTLTIDPPLDQGLPLHKVCPSFHAVLFFCVYAYIV